MTSQKIIHTIVELLVGQRQAFISQGEKMEFRIQCGKRNILQDTGIFQAKHYTEEV